MNTAATQPNPINLNVHYMQLTGLFTVLNDGLSFQHGRFYVYTIKH